MGLLIDEGWADEADEAPHRGSCEAEDGFHYKRTDGRGDWETGLTGHKSDKVTVKAA